MERMAFLMPPHAQILVAHVVLRVLGVSGCILSATFLRSKEGVIIKNFTPEPDNRLKAGNIDKK